MSTKKIYPNQRLIFGRAVEGQCPVCKKSPDDDWVWMSCGNRQVKVCKRHLGFKEDSLGRSTVSISMEVDEESDLEP